jgi:hypothetical protein
MQAGMPPPAGTRAKATPPLDRRLAWLPAIAVLIVLGIGAWVAWSGTVMAPDIDHQALIHPIERRLHAQEQFLERLESGLSLDTLRTTIAQSLAKEDVLKTVVNKSDDAKVRPNESAKAVSARRERLIQSNAEIVAERLVDLVRADAVLTAAAASLASEPERVAASDAAKRAAAKAVAAIEGKGLNEAPDDQAAGIGPETLRTAIAAALQPALEEHAVLTPAAKGVVQGTLQDVTEPAADRLQRRLGARVAWGTGVFALCLAVLACLAVSVVVILDVLDTKQARQAILLSAGVVTVLAALAVLATGSEMLGPKPLSMLLAQAADDLPALDIRRIATILDFLALSAIIAIVAAMCATLLNTTLPEPSAQSRLNLLFTFAATLLVTGVIEIGALYRLPASLVESKAASGHLETLAGTVAMAAAFGFSAALLAAYLVTYGVIRLRASGGLDQLSGVGEQLSGVLKVLAPAWVGLSIDQLLALVTQVSK